MANVRVAFEEFEGDKIQLPPVYQEVGCHTIFDIKMGENFRRKAIMVTGGHTTETPAALTYASVVSRDSVRIALTIVALNNLKVFSCDIQNAYLTVKCREKILTIPGPEFGSDAGKLMIILRALYGLKSRGAVFRALLAETLYDIRYTLSKADRDIWIWPAVKPYGFEYYKMILCYIDDALSILHDAMKKMKGIQHKFKLKDDKIAEPENYLVTGLSKMVTANGCKCWCMSPEKYCKAAVLNVEQKLNEEGKKLPTNCKTPLKNRYCPK